jgi:poly-gamma-glutamate synthesis protein (capsule biosynthesis protein)
MQTTYGNWQTPYGILKTDDDAVRSIARAVGASIEPETFVGEHGISALTPFIKRSFKHAKIIPIILHDAVSEENVEVLGRTIAKNFPRAVVIASADMSHYLPNYTAMYHDEVTLNALASGGCDRCELEVDANSVLRTLFVVNRERKNETWNLTHHNSSIGLGAASVPEQNTSHILGYFTKGKPSSEPFAAIHVVGDIMLDRDVRKKIEKEGSDAPWKNMHRFLSGSHAVVGNLEGTVSDALSDHAYEAPYRFIFDPKSVEAMKPYVDFVSLANNHAGDRLMEGEIQTLTELARLGIPWFGSYQNGLLRMDQTIGDTQITFIGYHAFVPNEQVLAQEIRAAKSDGRFVIVYPHWGTEYAPLPDSQQKRLATEMAQAGADLVIGGHPHVAQGIDLVEKTPVAWSLGNFIFDQPMPETFLALTIGVIVKPQAIELFLLPVSTKDGEPAALTDAQAKQVFQSIASRSDSGLQDQIKNGHLIFSR